MNEVDLFLSEDIAKGVSWLTKLNDALAGSKFGIVCVTRENFQKPWLNFEAGAIAKTVTESRCCPLLLDVEVSEIQGPLTAFQTTKNTPDDLLKLVKSINRELDEPLGEANLKRAFDKWLPDLTQDFEKALSSPEKTPSPPKRDPADIASETLEAVREQSRVLAKLVAMQSARLPSSASLFLFGDDPRYKTDLFERIGGKPEGRFRFKLAQRTSGVDGEDKESSGDSGQ
jgi:hypothetical protein